MVVTAGSVYTEAYKTVYNLIKDNATIASGTVSNFPQGGDVQYPIYGVKVDTDSLKYKSFANKNKGKDINVIVNCFAKSARQVDEIVSELENIVESNVTSLAKSGLAQPMFTRGGEAPTTLNDELVHVVPTNINAEYTR